MILCGFLRMRIVAKRSYLEVWMSKKLLQDSIKVRKAVWQNSALVAFLTGLAIIIDYLVPMGIMTCSLYMVPVIVAMQNPRVEFVVSTAVICSVLIMFGLVFAPEPFLEQNWKMAVNRGITIISVWIVVSLVWRIRGQKSLAGQNLEKLKDAIERFDLATEGASVGIWDWPDLSVDATFWSPKFYKLLGYRPNEIPSSISSFQKYILHPDDLPLATAAGDKLVTGIKPFDIEYRLKHKDGVYRWFRATAIVARDSSGQVTRMVGSIQDIHERKVLEEDLIRSNWELDQFAYIASHDLKTPLRGLHSTCEILQEDFGDKHSEEEKNIVQDIIEQARRMDIYISDLLKYSKAGSGDLEIEEVNISSLLEEISKDFSQSMKGSWQIKIIPSLPVIYGDRHRLGQLFRSLIENGLKFNDSEDKIVEIGQIKGASAPTFYVKDNGIGIDDKHREAVFRIFKRLHGQNAYGGGSGAGLTIAKRIIEKHRGSIWISPNDEQGSIITFTLELEEKNLEVAA